MKFYIFLVILFLLSGFGVGIVLFAPASAEEGIKIVVTPTKEPEATIIPTITLAPISTEKLETLVNTWRVSQNLKPLIHSENMCKIADIRLPEVKKN